jgi:hypothetical protein
VGEKEELMGDRLSRLREAIKVLGSIEAGLEKRPP